MTVKMEGAYDGVDISVGDCPEHGECVWFVAGGCEQCAKAEILAGLPPATPPGGFLAQFGLRWFREMRTLRRLRRQMVEAGQRGDHTQRLVAWALAQRQVDRAAEQFARLAVLIMCAVVLAGLGMAGRLLWLALR